jgi:hypothetical protein
MTSDNRKTAPSTANAQKRRQRALRELKTEFDRVGLDGLNRKDTRARLDAMFHAQGRTKKRPKAGPTY